MPHLLRLNRNIDALVDLSLALVVDHADVSHLTGVGDMRATIRLPCDRAARSWSCPHVKTPYRHSPDAVADCHQRVSPWQYAGRHAMCRPPTPSQVGRPGPTDQGSRAPARPGGRATRP